MATPKRNIIITGAGGMVGPLLATRLLSDPNNHVFLTDIVPPTVPADAQYPQNATCLQGDISSPEFIAKLIAAAAPLSAIFVFHGIMSAKSESDYDLSLKINIDSVRSLLEALRHTAPGTRVIYSSSLAVYGQPLPAKVTDAVTPTPESTYGAHKLTTEIYLNDMHRKGFVDAFILRFPTVVVRPGAPSPAASAFLSGMIREPMRGETCTIPLVDRSFPSFLCSPSALIENLVRVLALPSDSLPPHRRQLNMPGVSVTTQELMDGLAKFGGEDKLALLKEETNPAHERILRSWPQDFDNSTALRLGLIVDKKGEDLVKEYIDGLKK
jgi:nucleoside-diphosphate-sugar epimerase